MSLVALSVRLALAGLLFAAGLEKTRSVATLVSTMGQLGITGRVARIAAPSLIVAEFAVALGLIFSPRSPFTLCGVLLLAGAFAVAGAIALRRDEQIRCACFGSHRNTILGARQLAAFPLWLAAIALLWLQPVSLERSTAAYFAAVGLTLASLRAATAVAEARHARGDRRSATEMLVWLQ